ncbi:MAG: hypothetical protein FWH54_02040 [Methanobrevibacter sp.]|nr:hypothetical protein [Methanobrevibacter sp.]
MSNIQDLLKDKTDVIDYDKIIDQFPWIIEKDQNCILSPDSDGMLCGLLMSHLLNWKIKGFYDGKVMVLEKGLSAKDCVFLDMEIFRKNIKSFGHHMLLYNNNEVPEDWDNFENCIQPNILRNYDGYHLFRLKYPLGTIHMLLGIISHNFNINLSKDSIAPLFFVDGTFNVLFKYPENVMNWLNFLNVNEEKNVLKSIFLNKNYSIYETMEEMDSFFRKRDEISITKERGDRLKISSNDGEPYNIEYDETSNFINKGAVKRIKKFIKLLERFTGWEFKEKDWLWDNFTLYKFTKNDFKGLKLNVNGKNFKNLMEKNPLSWAMTSKGNIEYTEEYPDKMP